MNAFEGKKLLILAGASVHYKLVATAKAMGIYTIVTDYLEDSPAKMIADEQWMLDVNDVNGIVEKCNEKYIDGVICGWIDPCQRSYQEICEKLNLPCYGTKEQFYKMTDKHAFKKMCIENGVEIIPEYTVENVELGDVQYPVFIKPVDSRGSRGQMICYNKTQADNAINTARQESSNGDILIEKYVDNSEMFQITYFYLDGEPYIIRTTDGYNGLVEDQLDKLVLCSVSPSRYSNEYLNTTHKKVINMLRNIGIHDGPVMLQGFYDCGAFRFYDPGLRFPGVDFDLIYKSECGVDIMQAMIIFALSGEMPKININNDDIYLSGKKGAVLFPTISAGIIGDICGIQKISELKQVYSMFLRHDIGDKIEWTYTVNQRLAEIDLLADNLNDLKHLIGNIETMIKVSDTEGNDMLYKPFDFNRLK